MSFVVYHKETTKLLCNHPGVSISRGSFPTMTIAKAALTRQCNRTIGTLFELKHEEFAICTDEEFAKLEKTKVVKNLMTQQDVTIPVNTPYCCDPSTERYWSM